MPELLSARAALGADEEWVVARLAGARKAPADLVMRARIIALSWDGLRVAAIAGELGCHAKTVRWWLHRFNDLGLEGLEGRPITGRPRRLTERERSRVIAPVKQVPPGRPARQANGEPVPVDEAGPPEWTLDAPAEEARRLGIEVGRSQVRRILLTEGVRWRHTRSTCRRRGGGFSARPHPPGSPSPTPTRSPRPPESQPLSSMPAPGRGYGVGPLHQPDNYDAAMST
ncbi:helix-turn-helix domain-containing protein [Kitasatospora purpeofusca]|uniref:helix-turn-helix domain-containing protein n=1 Tax=Kitasatospora purpeofusca TaxID=67352 RepID=UPI0036589F6E